MCERKKSKLNDYNPLISVVVPVYNVSQYLTKCVKSILHQTYSNLEIMLIDDGSTDSSGRICDGFLKIDNRIKVFHKENSGLGLTRNYGIERASGKYIMFVDSDDYLGITAVDKLVRSTVNGRYDTIIGGYSRISNENKILSICRYDNKEFYDEKIRTNLLSRMLGNLPTGKDSIKMSVWNNLFDINIIKQNNLKFCSERKYISEDIVWDCDYFRFAKNVKVIDSIEYFYRYNLSSLTNSYRKDRFKLSVNLYKYVKTLIKNMNLSQEAQYRLQKQFFINTRTSIEQEKFNRRRIAIKNISNICNNPVLINVINEYPTQKLGISQRIFLYLIKNNQSILLFCLIKLEGLKK